MHRDGSFGVVARPGVAAEGENVHAAHDALVGFQSRSNPGANRQLFPTSSVHIQRPSVRIRDSSRVIPPSADDQVPSDRAVDGVPARRRQKGVALHRFAKRRRVVLVPASCPEVEQLDATAEGILWGDADPPKHATKEHKAISIYDACRVPCTSRALTAHQRPTLLIPVPEPYALLGGVASEATVNRHPLAVFQSRCRVESSSRWPPNGCALAPHGSGLGQPQGPHAV
mmetsp:Transcript_13813/g.38087  ORF Transcript_13813/g.38087 Transcript_13813/m.38087 type:complete len:228 (+) Transcript_13813:576-1259(+)